MRKDCGTRSISFETNAQRVYATMLRLMKSEQTFIDVSFRCKIIPSLFILKYRRVSRDLLFSADPEHINVGGEGISGEMSAQF